MEFPQGVPAVERFYQSPCAWCVVIAVAILLNVALLVVALFFLVNAFLRGDLPKDAMVWVLWGLIMAAPVASLIALTADSSAQPASVQSAGQRD
jgi:hypothetical protein